MNLMHLKYAVEVSDAASITRAAERLYISQPNLSRAIRDLEDALGIEIFRRTPKGIFPTAQGEEFLGYARKILDQVDSVEKLYRGEREAAQRFSISVPRASYIACAFTEFTKRLDGEKDAEIFYKETNSMRAITNILNADYRLGILRYQAKYDREFKMMLEEKNLAYELVCEFRYALIFSASHPLAEKESIAIADLSPYVEIAHADPYVPSLPASSVSKEELSPAVKRRIFVFERGSQMQLLAETPGAFMWVSPVPPALLDRFGLVQRACAENQRLYKDILIYKKGYSLSALDKLFIDELTRAARSLRKAGLD